MLTTNNATISACIAKSVVTQGNFSGFCLRFANDFQPWLDDWRDESYYDRNIVDIANDYDMAEFCYGVVINAFTVPQGSYKVIYLENKKVLLEVIVFIISLTVVVSTFF